MEEPSGRAGVPNEVGNADTIVAVSKQMQARNLREQGLESGDAVKVADLVLGEGTRPAADDGVLGGRERAEDLFE